MKIHWVTLFFLIHISVAQSEGFPFVTGERLNYEISYGFITAGHAELSVYPTPDPSIIELKSVAHSTPFFDGLFLVRDTVTTYVKKESMLPVGFTKVLNEGGWHNKVHIDFAKDPEVRLTDSVFTEMGPEAELKRFSDTTVLLDGPSHTITSAFYLFRTLELIPGSDYQFLAVSGKKKYKLKVLVHGKEKIETPAGHFDCIKVEPVLDEDGLFKAKGKLTIWLTDDRRRIPVLVKSKIAVGSIAVTLLEI